MQTFSQLTPVLPPIVNSSIACIHLNCKFLGNNISLHSVIKCAYQLDNKSQKISIPTLKQEILDLESVIVAYINLDNLNYISCNDKLNAFARRYDISKDIVDQIECLWKSIIYTTDLRVKYSTEETVGLSVFIFLSINHVNLDDIDSMTWFQHVDGNLTVPKLLEMFNYYSENCQIIDEDLREKINRFINRSVIIRDK